jgi:myo-inositol 2-dehydrogenase / D-chiro-inositol 1-dehydrogenase
MMNDTATSAVSRRTFLKTSAALAAGAALGAHRLTAAAVAPLILPGHARGADGQVAASNRINLAFIGTGRQVFYANLPMFLASTDVQVVAVCDVDRWRADQARQKVEATYAEAAPSGNYKGCAVYEDFREVLARPDIDAVMISTPDHWHAYMAIAAAKAGKDVALEKPISLSLTEGRAIATAMKQHGRIFRTDTEVRTQPYFHRLCQIVRNGRIGQVQRVMVTVPKNPDPIDGIPAPMPVPADLNYELWQGPAPEHPYTQQRVHYPRGGLAFVAGQNPGWFQITDYNLGNINNWGDHMLDITQWALGTERSGPVEVSGRAEFPSNSLWDVPRNFVVRYRYANGIEVDYTDAGRASVRIEGTEGWIEHTWFKSDGFKAHDPALLKWKPGPSDITLPLADEKEDFISCVKSRRETIIPAEIGHRDASMAQIAYIAARLDTKLRWDPVAEKFPGNDEANAMLSRPMRAPWKI